MISPAFAVNEGHSESSRAKSISNFATSELLTKDSSATGPLSVYLIPMAIASSPFQLDRVLESALDVMIGLAAFFTSPNLTKKRGECELDGPRVA